jgi:hypothetical protein
MVQDGKFRLNAVFITTDYLTNFMVILVGGV